MCPSAIVAYVALATAVASCGGKTVKPTVVQAVLPKAKPEARQFFEEGLRLMHRGGALEAAAERIYVGGVEEVEPSPLRAVEDRE